MIVVYLVLLAIVLFLIFWTYKKLNDAKHKRVREVFTNWLVFGILLSLIPFLFGIILMFVKGNGTIDLRNLVSNGELYLLAVTIGSSTLGNLIISKNAQTVLRILFGGICISLILCSAFLYALYLVPTGLDIDKIINLSPIFYLLSLISSGYSVIISEYHD